MPLVFVHLRDRWQCCWGCAEAHLFLGHDVLSGGWRLSWPFPWCVCVCGGGGVGLGDVSRVESSTRAPRLSSFILLGSSSDTLLMVSILDMVSAFSVLVGVKEVKAEFILAVFLYKKLSTWSMASSWRGILTGKLATNFFFLLPMFNLII